MVVTFNLSELELHGDWDTSTRHLTLARIDGKVKAGIRIIGIPIRISGFVDCANEAIRITAVGAGSRVLLQLVGIIKSIPKRLQIETFVKGDSIFIEANSLFPKDSGITVTLPPDATILSA